MSPLINHNLFINFSLLAPDMSRGGGASRVSRNEMFYKQVKCVQTVPALYLCAVQNADSIAEPAEIQDSNMTSQLINENISRRWRPTPTWPISRGKGRREQSRFP